MFQGLLVKNFVHWRFDLDQQGEVKIIFNGENCVLFSGLIYSLVLS